MVHSPNKLFKMLFGAVFFVGAISVCFLLAGAAMAEDWPTWRFDARRSASTPEQLASSLHLQWSSQQPPPRIAWPEDTRLYFDASLEPIVVGDTLYVGSSRNDSVTAINTNNGRRRWRFFADGPIRFAPLALEGRLYFGSDDGFFYCLNAADGAVIWKFRAAPGNRRVLGNERFISAWPLRGGAAAADGHLYFTAGFWPFEGAQFYDILADGKSKPQWRSSVLPEQVTPQGYLAADGNKLYIPSGRDKATGFDTKSGAFIGLNYSSRGLTDTHVTAEGNLLLHGDRIYDVAEKRLLPNVVRRPVTSRVAAYGVAGGNVVAYDLAHPQFVEKTGRKGGKRREKVLQTLWTLPIKQIAAATGASEKTKLSIELQAGNRLYGMHGGSVFALRLTPTDDAQTEKTTKPKPPAIVWTHAIPGTPTRMLAANGKLFVATREGLIHCFGDTAVKPAAAKSPAKKLSQSADASSAWKERVAQWLAGRADLSGYCLVLGAQHIGLVDALVRQTKMHVVVADASAENVAALRRHFDALHLYGERVSAVVGDVHKPLLPPYMMSLAFCPAEETWNTQPGVVEQIYRSLRPYGGRAVFQCRSDEQVEQLRQRAKKNNLVQAEITAQGEFATLVRAGALPGAADWTHEYGDSANSLMSQDELVRAPFGALWFGGPAAANDLFFDRHFWAPSLTVNQGRMFLQGPDVFAAIDIYTGRVLWRKKISQAVSPGRMGTFFDGKRVGFHFLAADDAVYLSDGKQCEKINPATGETLRVFQFKRPAARWGTMRLWKNRLICTVFLPGKSGKLEPAEIVSLDRHTGEEIWRHDAEYAAALSALGTEQVFYYDGVLEGLYDAWKRKGLPPKIKTGGYLKSLDIRTGQVLWQSGTARAVTWLGVSTQQGVLVASNKKGVEAWDGESGQALWEKNQDGKGFIGHPEGVWDKVILWNDRIIDQRGPGLSYDVKTGKSIMTSNPLTGKPAPWQFTKTGHHCNYAVASPHLLTFRAASAGFLDLETNSTGRLNGFRSGCRNSLIPAGGILNAPNFAHGCVCSYSTFTSLALVNTPQADLWTYNAFGTPKSAIKRLGVNLGAPGNRQADNGTLWLDYPSIGGPAPKINVSVRGKKPQYFLGHSLAVAGDALPWVGASGCIGLDAMHVRLGRSQPSANQPPANQHCRVRLYFVEPEYAAAGSRVFDVSLQGQPVLKDLDIWRQSGGRNRVLVRTFENVAFDDAIDISFAAKSGRPLLCGVEIVVAD